MLSYRQGALTSQNALLISVFFSNKSAYSNWRVELFLRLHRSVVHIFEVKSKEVAKWLKNFEKKEKEVDSDAQDLDSALAALKKLKVR